MGVSSYFEFVVVTFGWICYTRFWDVLVDTGVALVPFLGIVLGNVMEAKKAGDDEGSAAVQSLKKIEVDAVVAVFVMMVAAVPLFTLDMGQMRYVRPSLECGVAGGAVVTAGDATAPYGPIRARLSGVEARIPLWWAAFHQLSKAATSAAVAGIPCSADVKMMQYRIGTAAIRDENALRGGREFAGQCHRRALAIWREGQRASGGAVCPTYLPERGGCVPALPAGASDRDGVTEAERVKVAMGYMGSAWLRANIYPALTSVNDVSGLGIARNDARDAVYGPAGSWPGCGEWWTQLRGELIAGVDPDLWNDAVDATEGDDGQPRGWYARAANMWPHPNAEDAALAAILESRFRGPLDAGDGFGNVVSYDPDVMEQVGARNVRMYVQSDNVGELLLRRLETGVEFVGGAVGDAAGYAGTVKKALAISAEGMVIRETVSMLQGLAQLIFIIGLPFMLAFSSYAVGKLVLFTIVFFSIHFLSALWGIAFWIDNNLAAMLDYRHTGPTQTAMLHTVTKTVFIVVPSMWMAMMGWAGLHADGLVQAGMSQLGTTAARIGESGAASVEGVARKGASIARKRIAGGS